MILPGCPPRLISNPVQLEFLVGPALEKALTIKGDCAYPASDLGQTIRQTGEEVTTS